MPFIVRDDGTVVEAQTLDMDFNTGLSVGLLAPGVVVINIPALGITNAMLAADSVDGSKIVADTILDSDINSSAAILFSKLEAIPGMVRTVSQSFTGVSSVAVNNCFSATYDHYRILLLCTPNTSGTTIRLRMRVGGVDNSSANYQRNTHLAQSNAAHTPNVAGSLTATEFIIGLGTTASNPQASTIDICNPFSTVPTIIMQQETVYNNSTALAVGQTGGIHTGNTSFDGFSILPTAGTITGKVAVYGYS